MGDDILTIEEVAKYLRVSDRTVYDWAQKGEIPAGKIEAGESIEAAAIREAKEETGCELKDIKFLCSQNPANGMSDALVHCFAAKVQTEKAILDTDEISSKKWFSKQEYIELLKNNGTKDGVSILAVLFALQFYPFEENNCKKK